MSKLVLLRHGQSTWNQENRFTGWTDVGLSGRGVKEAQEAGRILKAHHYRFDRAYTSVLKRAIHTLWIVADEMNQMWMPVEKAWELNERHYGILQGLNKQKAASEYGADQIHQWRRGFAVRPPALAPDDPRHPLNDPRYAHVERNRLPGTESLEDTLARVLPYWKYAIAPQLVKGKTLLVVAHGNSLRALVKHLEGKTDTEIVQLEIPTGVPLIYEFDDLLHINTAYTLDSHDTSQNAA